MMLTKADLSEEQDQAVTRLIEHDQTLLVAPTGEGKTIICLTAITELREMGLGPFIVACPAKVIPVWKKEALKWEHTWNLDIVTLTGDPKARQVALADRKGPMVNCDIFVMSLNNLNWLLQQDHGCTGIIIDELSKAAGKHTQKLRTKQFGDKLTWRVGMTGTPVAQDFKNLIGQVRIVDGGKTLGNNKQKYLDRYGYTDYNGFNWQPHENAPEIILGKIKHLVHHIEDKKTEKLPALHEKVIEFDMAAETLVFYEKMKKDFIIGDVVAVNEAVKSGKLRQLGSGFLYNENGPPTNYDMYRASEAARWVMNLDDKGVIFYELNGQLEHLKIMFPKAIFITGGLGQKAQKLIDQFISGPEQLLIAQVNSMSHGIDGLQRVCSDVLFYHPIWSRDAYTQARDRLWRTGQENEVNSTVLSCRQSLDPLVLQRVGDNAVWMKMFEKHMRGTEK